VLRSWKAGMSKEVWAATRIQAAIRGYWVSDFPPWLRLSAIMRCPLSMLPVSTGLWLPGFTPSPLTSPSLPLVCRHAGPSRCGVWCGCRLLCVGTSCAAGGGNTALHARRRPPAGHSTWAQSAQVTVSGLAPELPLLPRCPPLLWTCFLPGCRSCCLMRCCSHCSLAVLEQGLAVQRRIAHVHIRQSKASLTHQEE